MFKKKILLFSILFLCILIYLSNNSDLRFNRRLFISLTIAWILTFAGLDRANANIIPGVEGFNPSISRLNPHDSKFNNPTPKRASQNIGKRLPSALGKPPRASSGFRVIHPIEKYDLYGGATGLSGNGGSSSSGGSGNDSNPNPFDKKSQDQCQNPNYLNQQKKKKKKSSYYCSEFDCIFESKKLQSKYKHAPDFGIYGNYNLANEQLFQKALIDHMREVNPRPGTYHGREVKHYLDVDTRLNVMIDVKSKRFLSAWRLSSKQLEHVLKNGNLGGG